MPTFLLVLLLAQNALPSGSDLLAKSLAYHDPEGTWMNSQVVLEIETGYADGRTALRTCWVDYTTGDYRDRREVDGRRLEQEVRGEACTLRVDGRGDLTESELLAAGLSCERARRMRDYVGYLWGLPMKLEDPGTLLGPVRPATFQNRDVLDLTVTYDPAVGTEIWHMYVDAESGRLVGYSFFKNPEETVGETIVLEGETAVGTARIPRIRHWYDVDGNRFLGTDTLVSGHIEPPGDSVTPSGDGP